MSYVVTVVNDAADTGMVVLGTELCFCTNCPRRPPEPEGPELGGEYMH